MSTFLLHRRSPEAEAEIKSVLGIGGVYSAGHFAVIDPDEDNNVRAILKKYGFEEERDYEVG